MIRTASRLIRCARCGRRHRVDNIELTFRRPDVIFALDASERGHRASESDDLCVLDRARFFARSILPLPVRGRDYPYCLGVWAELSADAAAEFDRCLQGRGRLSVEPLAASIANQVPLIDATIGLPVALVLSSRRERPALYVADPTHELFLLQAESITEHRAFEFSSMGMRHS